MKKWGFLFVIVACVVIALSNITPKFKEDLNIKIIEDKVAFEQTKVIEVHKEQIYQGNLVLVNPEHPVHEDSMKTDIVNVYEQPHLYSGFGLIDSSILMSEELIQSFSQMIMGAKEDGVSNFIINSGFRGFAEQDQLYQQMGADFALPAGYSEHNLGLSLDVGSTTTKMEWAEEGKWIEKNAWKYGFILRYPKNKTHITGIEYEPWHIRYVGLPHSAIMQNEDMVLEEYLEYLKDKKQLTVTVNGTKYNIRYYPITKSTTIQVPINDEYQISGNNIDGIIVTSN
ncbi:M15 family metallopeptidase [Lederbergia graminis]|uniref:D-alanyl-D-alanine carboxypeptidase family protein n=1 Tax=Lederbergia graminis TaxID=735518 RepID=A0ABW0LQX6_9BACI